jgi:osmotically-inducible protein OsmY
MKKTGLIKMITIMFVAGSIQLTACKNKSKDTSTTKDTTTVQTPPSAPVQISPDDSLTTGVRDATKDYPDVNASVSNGEVTLTGTIQRDRLSNLLQSIHALHPKKVNNNLTIK